MDNSTRPEVQQKTQAERVFEKFGGVSALHKALAAAGAPRALSSIYRWNQSKDKGGTDGLVPSTAWRDVLAAARLVGVVVTGEDFLPSAP